MTGAPGLLLAMALAAKPPAGPADLVVRGAARVVVRSGNERALTAFAVSGGRFVAIGSDAEMGRRIGPNTRVVSAAGATVVPGLIDAHLHLLGEGFRLLRLDLVGTRSKEEVLSRVKAAAAALPAGAWLQGRGWDQNDWPDSSYPVAADLDPVVPDHPVYLRRVDGHAAWLNSRALAAAGIDSATPDPAGGRIHRDREGRPTGILIDNAIELLAGRIPPPGAEERLRAARLAAAECVARGLTSVHEPGLELEDVAALETLCQRGELPLRVYVMLNPGTALDRYIASGPVIGACDGHLTVRALKIYADGALGSRGAALLEDYSDEAGNRGLLTTPPEVIARLAEKAARAGIQPCVHAIGDRANRLVLDVFEKLDRSVPGFRALRPRIEHAQTIAVEDIPRFAKLGVIASMQPTHATSDGPWVASRLGQRRLAGAYAWNRLLRSGARLAFGSDAPVESVDPRLGLYAARTRQDVNGQPEAGWQPEERLSGEAALAAFTLGAAYAAHEEGELGSIETGKRADFVILEGDPRSIDAQRLPGLGVRSTWVGGVAVFEASK